VIYPDNGPSYGKTIIQVTGSNFDNEVACLIDDIEVDPVIVSSTFILCEAPAHRPGTVDFELSFAGGVYQTTTFSKFTYYNDI
jgi:hypothetical protein